MSAETVFLSYVADDRVLAGRLKADLVRAGVTVVDRASLIKPENRVKAAVKKAIESASYFVLCLSSRDGLPPSYAKDEVAVALAAGRSIVPVRFTRCDIPTLDDSDASPDVQAVDVYDDWQAGVDQIVGPLPATSPDVPMPVSELEITCETFETGQLVSTAVKSKVAAKGVRIGGTAALGPK